jgi:hypothetical protein
LFVSRLTVPSSKSLPAYTIAFCPYYSVVNSEDWIAYNSVRISDGLCLRPAFNDPDKDVCAVC